MNTPSHLIFNTALFRKFGDHLVWPVMLGAFLPDLPVTIFFGWEIFIRRTPWELIVTERYFLPGWQNFIDAFNSVPLIVALMFLTVLIGSQKIKFFWMSALLHVALDIPVHTKDGHHHLFPFSDYKFDGGLSYWNESEYGYVIALLELVLVLFSSFYLFKKTGSLLVKTFLFIISIVYLASYSMLHLPSW